MFLFLVYGKDGVGGKVGEVSKLIAAELTQECFLTGTNSLFKGGIFEIGNTGETENTSKRLDSNGRSQNIFV